MNISKSSRKKIAHLVALVLDDTECGDGFQYNPEFNEHSCPDFDRYAAAYEVLKLLRHWDVIEHDALMIEELKDNG